MNALTSNNLLAAVEIDEARAMTWANAHYCSICLSHPTPKSLLPASRNFEMHCATCGAQIIEGGYIDSYAADEMRTERIEIDRLTRPKKESTDFDESAALKALGF